MDREEIITFLETEIERLKEKVKDNLDKEKSYQYYLNKFEYVKYLYKRITEEKVEYDQEEVEY